MNTSHIPSHQSRIIHAFGDEVHVHLGAAETNGAFAMFTAITPPGGGPPPHWHDNEDEWFHVLDGTVSFLVDGNWIDVEAGGSVLTPRGQVHAFKNNTASATRMLVHAYPAGFEDFFQKAADEFALPEGPNMERVIAIAEARGIHFVPPPAEAEAA